MRHNRDIFPDNTMAYDILFALSAYIVIIRYPVAVEQAPTFDDPTFLTSSSHRY